MHVNTGTIQAGVLRGRIVVACRMQFFRLILQGVRECPSVRITLRQTDRCMHVYHVIPGGYGHNGRREGNIIIGSKTVVILH